MDKKTKIEELALSMLEDSIKSMKAKIKKALDSGAIDIDAWDASSGPMILPKTIIVAILADEARQYDARGTSFEKKVKKEAKNIQLFL